jgi:malonyl-CoA decarboxylase
VVLEGEKGDGQHRPLAQRLEATLRRGEEALSPRELRRLLQDMQQVADTALSDVEGGRHAQVLMEVWQGRSGRTQGTSGCWRRKFGPDAKALQAARERYDKAGSDVERGEAEMSLRRALVSSRTRLQRLPSPRAAWAFWSICAPSCWPCPRPSSTMWRWTPSWSICFPAGSMWPCWSSSLNWDSPASLLEKLIKYEAVHDIRSWADLKIASTATAAAMGSFTRACPMCR